MGVVLVSALIGMGCVVGILGSLATMRSVVDAVGGSSDNGKYCIRKT